MSMYEFMGIWVCSVCKCVTVRECVYVGVSVCMSGVYDCRYLYTFFFL